MRVSIGSRDPLPNEANIWSALRCVGVRKREPVSKVKQTFGGLRCVDVREREPVSKFIFEFLRKTNAVDKVS